MTMDHLSYGLLVLILFCMSIGILRCEKALGRIEKRLGMDAKPEEKKP